MADYVLAGRALTLPSFVATLVPTFYGGVLGIGEFTWRSGLSNWTVMALPYYVFAAIYALFLAKRVRLQEGLTIPDHLEAAYGRPLALAGAGLVFLLVVPADELLMAGTLISRLASTTRPAAMALAAFAAVAVLWRGGLRSDVWSNRLQIVLMYAGFAAIVPAALRALPPSGLAAALPAGHLSWTGTMGPARLIAWWLIAVWTLVDPSFHQRCAAAKDPSVARAGILLSICFWAAFDLMTTTAGLYARALEPGLADPLMAFPALADRLLAPALRGFFYAGLAASITAALQGKALQAAVALGKDTVGRATRASEQRQESWTRIGIIAALALSWLLAWLLPSVVGLWYALGSAAIPGLLLPLLGVYWPGLRRAPGRALAASLCGFGASLGWLALGAWKGGPYLGVEPMFPGLILSAAIWFSAFP